MSEEPNVVKNERELARRTARFMDSRSTWCSICYGKMAEVFTCRGETKGANKYIKSVYDKITWRELNKILYFDEAPKGAPAEIILLFWKPRSQNPLKQTLHYNCPNQLDNHEKNPNLAWVKKLVK